MPGYKSAPDGDRYTHFHGKKNKAKKKKDLNKKGESKEGGEMDAFIDKEEEVVAVPVSTLPPLPPAPVADRAPSPVPAPITIVDSEILRNIPLPGEILPDISPQSDISPSEQTSETSSVSPTAESEDKENVDESAQNKMVLKYSYKEDQWSPLNPEGKKQYDRDFLLQLQGQPMSLCKPSNLPNLDVIKDKAHIQKLNEINRSVPMQVQSNFRDHFLPTYAQRGVARGMSQLNYSNQRSLQGRDSKIKKVGYSYKNVKLHKADNPWKLGYKQEAPEEEALKRIVQSILNKITPQKFETLVLQLKHLNIDTEEKLTIVIDLIFKNTVNWPNFSVVYANMCKHLALIKVPTENRSFVNFRKHLLTKCQKQFEQDRSKEIKQKAVEEAAPEKRKELEQEMYEEEKMRYRQLGNLRFIGELFNLHMLIEPIMHDYIKTFLMQGDEESLECLCRLLKTIGKKLNEGKTKNSKETMEMYFQQMQKVVDKRLTSPRIRFMLQDVIDLKRCNWVPRREENIPKTIDQIHKEAEREAREQQQNLQNMPFQNKRLPDDRDRRKNTVRNTDTSEDGSTSSTKSKKGKYTRVDTNKLLLTKGLVRGGTTSETKVVEIKKSPESQLNGKTVDSTELRLKGVELSDEQMEKKTKPLIDEFLHNNDAEEAIRCVMELASPSTIHMFINSAINQVLERSSQARHSLGQLLFSLVKQQIITFDQYKKGFACVLEFVDEFALDIPLIWEYIGEILEPMLEDNKFPLVLLKEILLPCIPSETAGMLVSATLHCAAKKRGTIQLGELWRESNLQWTDFLDASTNIDEFIQKHKLEFTILPVVKAVSPMSTEEIKKHLLSLLEKTEECEEIFDWITANVPENSEPSFIRALVSVVHENAIKDSGTGCELDVTKLKKRISILTRYIEHNENLELQALYAIQSLMNQLNQPKGILRQIFDILYDDDVITEDSFKNWEKSEDVNEAEGKGVALHSVKSFFTWLKEADSGDSVTEE